MDPAAGQARRRAAENRGRAAEDRAVVILRHEGWTILARRARTPLGEIDLIAERDGLLAFVEVKARTTLAEAAFSLAPRQRARIAAAAETWLAANPDRGRAGARFDVMLLDDAGGARRIVDAFRVDD